MADVFQSICFIVLRKRALENGILKEERSSLWSAVPAVHVSSAGDSVESLTLFQNDIATQLFGESMSYRPKKKNESYANSTFMSISRPYTVVVSVAGCSVKTKNVEKIEKRV